MEMVQIGVGLLIALIGAAVTLFGVRYSHASQVRRDAQAREDEADRLMRKYRDPLIRAAFDLQSRLYNIVVNGVLRKYVVNGTESEREYAHENTLHVLAEYFGWVEVLRREIQFMDLRDAGKNRQLSVRLDAISRLFLGERPDTTLRVFRGEQRAIGEVMLVQSASGGRETMGYATFVARRKDPEFSRWFRKLSDDVRLITDEPGRHEERAIDLQHALIELLDFLDPMYQYFPESMRRKIPRPAAVPPEAAPAEDEAGKDPTLAPAAQPASPSPSPPQSASAAGSTAVREAGR